MEEVNILIIGAGAVGLAIAENLSKTGEEVVVVEKESTFGRHTSSRNSEVIHSGIYYPQGTLKAALCVKGVKLIYHYLSQNNIPFSNCGKLVVACDYSEEKALTDLMENGMRNGVEGLQIIEQSECLKLEPQIKAVKALQVASTGILDTHKFMQSLASNAEKNDVFIIYDMEVTAIEKNEDRYLVKFHNGETYAANYLINSAGLHSDQIAEMAGIDLEKHDLKLHWCKGEYYKTSKIKNIHRLIYPLPDRISLGIHLTINLAGNIRFGPSAYYLKDLDYSMDEKSKDEFLLSINRYLDLLGEDLEMDDCGIRPKLQSPVGEFRDFYIKEESEKGLPNFINLIGIESPGLTASLAIAEYVKDLMN